MNSKVDVCQDSALEWRSILILFYQIKSNLTTRQFLRRVILLCWITFLSACVHQPILTESPLTIENESSWFLKARVAIKTEQENVTATLEWQNDIDEFDFHVYGLFGATYAHLIRHDNIATLKLPENQIFQDESVERLMMQHLGWEIPIDALGYWVKGHPSGQVGELIYRDEDGQIERIEFREWQVDYSRFGEVSGYQLPQMIKVNHPQLSLKIVVKDWTFGDED